MELRNFYDYLGVPADASLDDIKRAYRRLAREYHPDTNTSDEARVRFHQIQEAYDVLGNIERRVEYDDAFFAAERREERIQAYQRQQAAATSESEAKQEKDEDQERRWKILQSYGTEDRENGSHGDHGEDSDAAPPPGALFSGLKQKLRSVLRPAAPHAHGGTHASRPENPLRSHKHSVPTERPRFYQFTISARESLSGTSREVALQGNEEPRIIRVRIPSGVADNSTLRVNVPATEEFPGQTLDVRIRIESDPLIDRSGNDITVKVPVTVQEALSGAEIDVPTLEGTVRVKIPTPWTPDSEIRLARRGVRDPVTRKAGDLLVRTYIVLPMTTTPQALQAARLIEELYIGSVRRRLPTSLKTD